MAASSRGPQRGKVRRFDRDFASFRTTISPRFSVVSPDREYLYRDKGSPSRSDDDLRHNEPQSAYARRSFERIVDTGGDEQRFYGPVLIFHRLDV